MFNSVIEIIMKNQNINADQIHMDSHLINDLSINSFEMIEMICDLEDSLGIEIPEEHIIGFRTVRDVVEYLEKIAK